MPRNRVLLLPGKNALRVASQAGFSDPGCGDKAHDWFGAIGNNDLFALRSDLDQLREAVFGLKNIDLHSKLLLAKMASKNSL
jgi:hypothetical protein